MQEETTTITETPAAKDNTYFSSFETSPSFRKHQQLNIQKPGEMCLKKNSAPVSNSQLNFVARCYRCAVVAPLPSHQVTRIPCPPPIRLHKRFLQKTSHLTRRLGKRTPDIGQRRSRMSKPTPFCTNGHNDIKPYDGNAQNARHPNGLQPMLFFIAYYAKVSRFQLSSANSSQTLGE